jgi:SAM-dependent methyltransferase
MDPADLGRRFDPFLEADRIFLETTRRFAPPRLAQEDVRTALELAQVDAGKPVADLGCGYGRHLRALREAGHPHPIGIDRSPLLLAEARAQAPGARLLRADLKALPLHAGALSAAFCFYSSMFLGSERDSVAALRECARVLRPGGALVLTTDNPLRLAANPRSRYQEDVPGLGQVVEESAYDARESVDRVHKRLRTAGGEELSATFLIRYYAPPRLAGLALEAGLLFRRLEPDAALTESTPQLIALLEKVP